MSDVVIQAEKLGKKYRLGTLNRKMLGKEIESWWARRCGKEDPHSYIHDGSRNVPLKSYDFWALSDVSFKIRRGDAIGIMGRNGSGKSTLLKLLSRITAPTTGTAKIKGHIASLLEVGTGFHNELTGRENVFLNGAILGMKRHEIEERYGEIVQFSEVEKFMETPVKRYSSGMRVRLAFAVAAHLSPEILILDEVIAVGDAKFQEKCLKKIEATKALGTTVMMVSHSAQSVLEYCNRAIVLEGGRIVADAGAREGVEFYLNMLDLEQPMAQIAGHPSARHGEIIGAISALLLSNLKGGSLVISCPVQTNDGIRQVDVGWVSDIRLRTLERSPAYSAAPDICVHVVSPERSVTDIDQSIPRLFKSGAVENWICDLRGNLVVHRNRADIHNSSFFQVPEKLNLN
ncbi:MAG: hypothetical protein C5B47_05140 [Verrucomicrobia bacterium]|nr:MAG: hypothetical protein C5B47_05140 [Verrucomicrobiota bacterium]